jgi:putative PIN family toxin of toxin-antitoxin system
MRVVVDTNVLVSGLLTPFGPPGTVVRLIVAGRLQLCYDARIVAEYREVLGRPSFPFAPDETAALTSQIEVTGVLASATPLAFHLPDPDDEPFLEVAIATKAEFLVTGNGSHFPPGLRCGICVVSPREFIDAEHIRIGL